MRDNQANIIMTKWKHIEDCLTLVAEYKAIWEVMLMVIQKKFSTLSSWLLTYSYSKQNMCS